MSRQKSSYYKLSVIKYYLFNSKNDVCNILINV